MQALLQTINKYELIEVKAPRQRDELRGSQATSIVESEANIPPVASKTSQHSAPAE
jgi:hypothetical protein